MSASRWVNSSTARDVFHDVVREVDNSIGAVVAALKAAGVYDNTFIFATADKCVSRAARLTRCAQRAHSAHVASRNHQLCSSRMFQWSPTALF